LALQKRKTLTLIPLKVHGKILKNQGLKIILNMQGFIIEYDSNKVL
jgi:hypothetical protein